MGCGTQTAALGFAGFEPPTSAKAEKWNGTSWTEVGDLNTARRAGAGAGTNTSALAFSGGPPNVAVTESWDGSSWTEVGDLNTAREGPGGGGESNTSALCFAGYAGGNSATTEEFDGSSWTEVADLSVARYSVAGTGTQSDSLCIGGTGDTNATEEWTKAQNVKTITD